MTLDLFESISSNSRYIIYFSVDNVTLRTDSLSDAISYISSMYEFLFGDGINRPWYAFIMSNETKKTFAMYLNANKAALTLYDGKNDGLYDYIGQLYAPYNEITESVVEDSLIVRTFTTVSLLHPNRCVPFQKALHDVSYYFNLGLMPSPIFNKDREVKLAPEEINRPAFKLNIDTVKYTNKIKHDCKNYHEPAAYTKNKIFTDDGFMTEFWDTFPDYFK